MLVTSTLLLKNNTVKTRKTHCDKFPFTLHKTGRFCKKIKDKIYSFGKDQNSAFQRYLGKLLIQERLKSYHCKSELEEEHALREITQKAASALDREGPWKEQNIDVNRQWCKAALEKTIQSLDWKTTAEDMQRFVRVAEQPSLDLWSQALFLSQLKKTS